jgi:hypothetical protein
MTNPSCQDGCPCPGGSAFHSNKKTQPVFDLERAKKEGCFSQEAQEVGELYPARIICTDVQGVSLNKYEILALIKYNQVGEIARYFKRDGTGVFGILVNKPQIVKVWTVVWRGMTGDWLSAATAKQKIAEQWALDKTCKVIENEVNSADFP